MAVIYFAFSLDPVHCSTKLSVWAGAALYFLQTEAALISDCGWEQTGYRYVLYMTPLQKTRAIPLSPQLFQLFCYDAPEMFCGLQNLHPHGGMEMMTEPFFCVKCIQADYIVVFYHLCF